MSSYIQYIAPARSKYMAQQMIQSGATELYIGLKPHGLSQLSYDGRFQTIAEYPAQIEDEEQFKEIVELAHQHGLRVNFMANAAYIPPGLQEAYIDHIKRALKYGIDMITVSSIQAIHLLQSAGIDTPIAAGSSMCPTNAGMMQLLKSLGVCRVTIPQALHLEEVKALKEIGLEIIVKGNFGSGGLAGSCRLWESPNNTGIGDGTRTAYRVTFPNGEITRNVNFLDAAPDCSLCSLQEMIDAGITGLQFIGREAPNPVMVGIVVDLFRQWVDLGASGIGNDEKIKIMEREQLMWTMKWAPRFCQQKRCTYLKTPVTQSYV